MNVNMINCVVSLFSAFYFYLFRGSAARCNLDEIILPSRISWKKTIKYYILVLNFFKKCTIILLTYIIGLFTLKLFVKEEQRRGSFFLITVCQGK